MAITARRSIRSMLTALGATGIVLATLLTACAGESAGQGDTWHQQGQLLAWDRDIWIVDAIPIVVPASVLINGEQLLGSQVDAEGSFDQQGRMVAQTVRLSNGSLPDATLSHVTHEGIIASISGDVWVVDEMTVVLPNNVTISAGAEADAMSLATVGHHATVSGYRFGERMVIASEIELRATTAENGSGTPDRAPVTVEASEPPQEEEQPQPPDNPGGDDERDDRRDDDDDDGDDKKEREAEREREKQEKDAEKERDRKEKQDKKDRDDDDD